MKKKEHKLVCFKTIGRPTTLRRSAHSSTLSSYIELGRLVHIDTGFLPDVALVARLLPDELKSGRCVQVDVKCSHCSAVHVIPERERAYSGVA